MGKKPKLALLGLTVAAIVMLFLSGCRKDTTPTRTYTLMKPVFKDKAAALASVNGDASRPMEAAGKIYINGQFIFLNEIDKGIHVIDNSDPHHPTQIAFLDIPGNQDIAVKGHILYADMYSDLLAIDISDPRHVTITSRLPNLFLSRVYVNDTYIDSNHVVVDWIKKDTTVRIEGIQPPVPGGLCDFCAVDFASNNPNALAKSSSGVAGSMAKMVMIHDYLYAISESHSVGVVNTSNATVPSLASTVYAGFDLETIYPFENKLFLGSSIGMYMYDVSDPGNLVKLGEFSHGRACDPVVTDGTYAYVTLRSGSFCGGANNELNVIDVQDLMNPVLIKSYPMTGPTGLSKDGNLLLICDGKDGVKLYDASNVNELKQLGRINSDNPYDVIAMNKWALVVAKDGLYQYDYSDIHDIRLLSFFSVKR